MAESLWESLGQAEGFQWDEGNVAKIWDLHQVSPGEAEQVFFNLPVVADFDIKHSSQEIRFFALGQTDTGRRLFVVFTIRDALIRVISARDMSRRERKEYENAQKAP